MSSIRLSTRLGAGPDLVWERLADLAQHPEWMADAESVEFLTEQRTGVGTVIRVPTKIGPFRTEDLIEVVGWEEKTAITVEHRGLFSGEGRFEIRPDEGGTELSWTETLRFPWWLGGPLGALMARPFLIRVWRANLRRFGERLGVSDP